MRIYFIITSVILIISCNDKGKVLPDSTGSNAEILFVAPDHIWDLKIKERVFNIFCKQIPGLASPESSFNIIQVNNSELTSLLKTHTNIIILSNDTISKFINNLWANNQLVTHLSYIDDLKSFDDDCENIFNAYYSKELRFLRKRYYNNSNKDYARKIHDAFGIDIILPLEYSQTIDSSGVMLFSYNPENHEQIKQIIIYKILAKSANKDLIIDKTNKILLQNLKGSVSGSHVTIENRFPAEIYNNTYRTLWKLNKGFMGGPILIKPYTVGDYIVVACALVFDPSSSKRKYIKEFESIL